ncbi:MAG: glycosyltransferase [Acidobacteria bacterium]|nr:glycosyltransferase [Acidobacteriota bacterium]
MPDTPPAPRADAAPPRTGEPGPPTGAGAPLPPAGDRRVVCSLRRGVLGLSPVPRPGSRVTLVLEVDGAPLGETPLRVPPGDFLHRRAFRDFLLDRFGFDLTRRFLAVAPGLPLRPGHEAVTLPFGKDSVEYFECTLPGGPYRFAAVPPRKGRSPAGEGQGDGAPDPALAALEALSHRALADLAAGVLSGSPARVPQAGEPGPGPSVFLAFGSEPLPPDFRVSLPEGPPSPDGPASFLFHCARSHPHGVSVTRQGRRVVVRARRFTLLDLARVLMDLAGDAEFALWTGKAARRPAWASPRPAPGPGDGPRPGVELCFGAGTGPDASAGPCTLRPWEAVARLEPAPRVGVSRGFLLRCTPSALLRLMPTRLRDFAARGALHVSLADFVLSAAQQGASVTVVEGGGGPGRGGGPCRGIPARRWAGLASVGMAAVRRGKLERNFRAFWGARLARGFTGAFLGALFRRPLGLGAARAALLSGALLGLFRKPPGRFDHPPVHFPEAPVRRVEFDLLRPEVADTGDPSAPVAFAVAHLDGEPVQCLGTDVYGGASAESLARRLRLETFLWKSGHLLRYLAWTAWEARVGSAASDVRVAGRAAPELILATRDRPRDLERLVASLRRSTCPVDLRVIDSAPSSEDTRRFCEREGIRYHRCPHPGKSRALNLGIRASEAEYLLFTDDDAVVDANWARALTDGFRDPAVRAVVGLVLPLRVQTRAQYLFEHHVELYGMGGLRRGFWEREYGPFDSPFAASRVGTGVNMAVRREVFETLGPLDTALSPGTPTGAGEEVDLYFRILRRGGAILYTPRARVLHDHRDRMDALRRQLFNYGLSSGAYSARWAFVERAPRALWYLWKWYLLGPLHRCLGPRPGYPRSLVLLEAWGSLRGPLRYCSSRRLQRRFDREEREGGTP